MKRPNYRPMQPTEKFKRESKKSNFCSYCNREFFRCILTGRMGRYSLRLRPNWDHYLPFSLYQDNSNENYVLCCNVCNIFKGNKVFSSIVELAKYLEKRWAEKYPYQIERERREDPRRPWYKNLTIIDERAGDDEPRAPYEH